MVKKKKLTREEKLKGSIDRQYRNSQIIAERYPNIKSLTIKMTFFDVIRDEKIEERTRDDPIRTARAFFYEECPSEECVDGGFNLTKLVESTIKKGDAHSKGNLFCCGSKDRERVGMSCDIKLYYEIFVEYL